ncbi:MAG: stage III sporulation protein AG [Clostridiales bacterium]|nr:stage III sporulation protein AG [Clostridiales bacterium]
MEEENKVGILKKLKLGKKPGKDQFVIFILVGILFIIIALPTSQTSGKNSKESRILGIKSDKMELTQKTGTEEKINDKEMYDSDLTKGDAEVYEQYMENKLEQVISAMEGAGKSKVAVTVSTSKEAVVEKDIPEVKNSTAENDAQGGSRNIEEVDTREETVYLKENDGSSIPYVVKTLQPEIEGVVVVVQGGDKPEVRKNITEAIVALFDIESHKIKIIKMKSE